MNHNTTATEVQQVSKKSLLIQDDNLKVQQVNKKSLLILSNLEPLNEAEQQGVVGGFSGNTAGDDGGGIANWKTSGGSAEQRGKYLVFTR